MSLNDEGVPTYFTDYLTQEFDTATIYRYQAKKAGETVSYLTYGNYSSQSAFTPAAWTDTTLYSVIGTEVKTNLWLSTSADSWVENGGSYYVLKVAHTANAAVNEPGSGSNWGTYWTEVDQPQREYAEAGDFEFTDSEWSEEVDKWLAPNLTTDTYTIKIYGIKLYTVLAELLNDIDPTIDIAETGTDAFCSYLESSFPNKLRQWWYSYEDEPKLSLQTILDIFANVFNMDWRIEGTDFKFIHKSERPTLYTGGNYDLTNFKSENWTVYEYQYEITEKVKKDVIEFAE